MPDYEADLHIHTVLSPCAEVEMIPPLIVEKALDAGLDMIAVTDHNSAENVQAVIDAARDTALRVIPGIECESIEGVHIVCLFDEASAALRMQKVIYDRLPDLKHKASKFGEQFVVDSEGEFVRRCRRLLMVPTELTIKEIAAHSEEFGGFAFPAHVDRTAYGMYGVLGFMPPDPDFRAVEVSKLITPAQALERYADLEGRTIFRNSDAHRLEEIGLVRTRLNLRHRTVCEIRRLVSEG